MVFRKRVFRLSVWFDSIDDSPVRIQMSTPVSPRLHTSRRMKLPLVERPNFGVRVRALRVIDSVHAVSSVVEGEGKDGAGGWEDGREARREKDGEDKEKGRKRRKVKLEWRERWVVHQGTPNRSRL